MSEWTATPELRWMNRGFYQADETGRRCFAGKADVLQQKWISVDGVEWRDVPRGAEEQVDAGRHQWVKP